MSDKPERIWATDQFHHVEKNPNNYYSTEYIRADLADAKDQRIKELEEALAVFADVADECDEYGSEDNNQAPVTAGECREARAALSKGATK